MAAVTFGDELVRDYLVFRGFLTALKAFDGEVKSDKDRGFRPDRIVEHLTSCITNLDLTALREAWSHLEHKVFSRLEHSFLSTARKLENALLRMYLMTCISASRHDKLLDFFEKMTPELQGQSDWKEWFALPFLKNPDENPTFSVFFTRQWQDTMLVSLHNFISVVFQSIATPSLLSYEEELFRLNSLQEENEMLRAKLASAVGGDIEQIKCIPENETQEIVMPAELMDDFYVIAQEAPAENVSRSIKSLIKNISGNLPTSPILGRHIPEGRRSEEHLLSGGLKSSRIKPRSPSVPPQPSSHMCTSESSRSTKEEQNPSTKVSAKLETTESENKPHQAAKHRSTASSSAHHSSMPVLTDPKSGFLILSQEEYTEHNSFITQCRFNSSGSCVASSDADGVIKVWNASPCVQTHATFMSKGSVFALEWAPKKERLLLHGSALGKVRLYDTKERKIVGEAFYPNNSSCNSDNQSHVLSISCNPTEANFIASTNGGSQSRLCLFNMRTLQMELLLPFASKNTCCYCSSFNHNGQLLLAGTQDGYAHIFDLRSSESIATWLAHSKPILGIQFSSDENACYTMGQDGKFLQWSINKTGHLLGELAIHPGATQPFSRQSQPAGRLFAFNGDASHVLTCGPFGGVIYKASGSMLTHALNIGGHNCPITAVDWLTAMECSMCLCGSSDGKITVSTLMAQ